MEGFIRMTSDGATPANVGYYYKMMWLLAGVYFITATVVAYFHRRLGRNARG